MVSGKVMIYFFANHINSKNVIYIITNFYVVTMKSWRQIKVW